MENLIKNTSQTEVIGVKNYCPPNWGFLIFMYGIIFLLPYIIFRYKPSEDLIILNKEKKTIFLDQKKREIELENIEHIIVYFRMIEEPHGKIIIRTKDGKKYKQKHLANIFGVAERIVDEVERIGIEPPKILWAFGIIKKIPIETEEHKLFFRNHMKTGVWVKFNHKKGTSA